MLENKLWENAAKMGSLLIKRLKEFVDLYEIVGEARGKGLMLGLEFVKKKETKEPAPEETALIRKLSADFNLIVGAGGWWKNVIRIQPPLTITEDHINRAMNSLEKAIKKVNQKNKN
jgi:4-aminobutyrate aminotransferase-like enzyme